MGCWVVLHWSKEYERETSLCDVGLCYTGVEYERETSLWDVGLCYTGVKSMKEKPVCGMLGCVTLE